MKARRTMVCLLAMTVSFAVACNGDDGDADEGEAEGASALDDIDPSDAFSQLGVVVESKGSDVLRLEQDAEHQIEFCYAGEGCEGAAATMGDTTTVGGEGATSVLASSDPDRSVVGVRVAFETSGDGEGVVTVGEGTLEVDDDGVVPDEDFEFSEILDVSEPVSGGETVSFEVGATD